MRRFKAALIGLLMTLSLTAPAFAVNRVQWLNGLQPPSQWLNVEDKDVYVGVGQLIWDIVGRGNSSGFFTNAQLVPDTAMYVTVAPINNNEYASLYQTGVTDLNPFGSGPGQLPADGEMIFHQALLSTTANTVGPLVAPTTSGDSVKDLIECEVQINDTTQQTVNFVSSTNVASSSQAYRDRADQWYCQAVLGTQATTGTEVAPTPDPGWVALGTVDIPYSTTTITSAMITTNPNWNGFLPAGSASTFMDLVSNQTAAGNKTFTGVVDIASRLDFSNGTISFSNLPQIAGDYQANPGLILNVATGSNGVQFMTDGALNGASVSTSGTVYSGSSYLAKTAFNVAGPATINGATFDGTTLTAGSNSLRLNAKTGGELDFNYGSGITSGITVWDGGTTNYAQVNYGAGLVFSGASTSAYTKTDATIYGNLTMPNQAAGQCAQFDANHHLVAAGGACGLTSGTLTSVSSVNSNLLSTTTSGAVSLDFLHAPKFQALYVQTPDAVTGYNVYVGTTSGNETKQNASPIAIGTNWTEPTSGLVSGASLPTSDSAAIFTNPATPTLGSSAGGTLGATTYYVKLTYVTASGESYFPSPEQSKAVAANNVLTVTSPAAYTPASSVANLIFGADQGSALTRNGGAFKFQPWTSGTQPTVEADGGFIAQSAYYYPTYATVPGTVTANLFSGSGASLTNLPLNQFSGLTASRCLRATSTTTIASGSTDCLTGLTAGTGIAVGSGTSPSVGITNGGVGQTQVANGYVDLSNNQTIGGTKTFSAQPTLTNGFNVSGTAASYMNGWTIDGAATTDFYLGSTGTTAGTIHYRTNGYSNGDIATLTSTTFTMNGTVAAATLNASGLSASTCLGADASKNIVSSANCLQSLSVTGPIGNSGTALNPNITCSTCVTNVLSSGPISSSGGTTPTIGCATCVVSVGASGPLSSTGGTSPSLSCGSCLTTGGGQSVGGTETFNAVTVSNSLLGAVVEAKEGTPNGLTGFSFQGDGGEDTGMFSTTDGDLRFYANNTEVMDASSSANLTAYGTITAPGFINSSRRILKHDIHSLVGLDAIDLLKRAEWVSFKYKRGAQDTHYGFIADDTPSILSGPKHDHFDAETTSTIDALAILQEDHRIDQLQREVNLLNARVATLEMQGVPARRQPHSVWWYIFHPWVGVGN